MTTPKTGTSTGPSTGKLRVLLALMRGQRVRYGAAIVALAIGTLLLYCAPLITSRTIDGILRPDSGYRIGWLARFLPSDAAGASVARTLLIAGAAMIATTALGGLFIYLKGRWSAIASEQIARNLRERLYDHLQHLPAAWHDAHPTGDVVQRCTSDVDTIRQFYLTQVIEIARAALLLLIVVPILLSLDVTMAFVSLGLMPIIVGFAVVFFTRVQGAFKAMDEAEGAMTATLQENLTGIRVVRAFARQEYEIGRFGAKNAGHRDLHWRLYKLLSVYWSISDLMCFTQMSLVLFVGAWRASRGDLTVGVLVAFVAYAQMYIWPVRQTGRVLTELGKALVALTRVQEILESAEESDSPAAAIDTPPTGAPPAARGEIAFENVTFEHGGKPAVQGISLHVPAGSTLALVGPSGAGKSTLMHLLLRLYDLKQGTIRIDGVDIATMPRKAVRSLFGVVMQEPFLYSKSLGDNIRLGRFSAAHDEVVEAASTAAIHDAIENFDNKYETLVGERGVTLSGGQRQRVAIARALLRDAPVLILDDALSAVDTHTEAAILDALKQRRHRRTTIVIAHRLSTLMHADRIAVLEHGQITQLGTHEELIARPGLYQRLWQIQTSLEEDLQRELAPEPPSDPVADLSAAN